MNAYIYLCTLAHLNNQVKQGCPILSVLFNFFMNVNLDTALVGVDKSGANLLYGERLFDLLYADDTVLVFDGTQVV